MSKIYRRPMFRGGGKVSSYGNGITAPLVPGYQGGGQIGGGIIYGKPMADGRYGFETSSLKPQLPEAQPNKYLEMITNMFNKEDDQITTGGELLSKYNNVAPDGVPKGVVIDNGQPKEINKKNSFEFKSLFKKKKEGDFRTNADKTADPKSASDGLDYLGDGITDEMLGVDINTVDMKDVLVDVLVDGKIVKVKKSDTKLVPNNEDGSLGGVTRELKESAKPNNAELPKNMKSFPRDVEAMGANSDPLEFTGNEPTIKETEASLAIDPRDAIAQNQELFKELLGSKKARGQDISDMLLRFSGSQGNTLGEKFSNYTRAESAAGPGRLEKINQTAAALSINDYVAGKRSAEQIDKLKEVERFKNDEAVSRIKIGKDDSFRDALNKKATSLKAGSTSSSKVIGETIRDILDINGDGRRVFAPSGKYKNRDSVNKKIKDLNVGINIIVYNDGTVDIVEKIAGDSQVSDTPFQI